MNLDHFTFLYDHAMTIEGLITFIVLISIVGVIVHDWAERGKRRHEKRTKRMIDEHASNPGAESYRGER